MLTPLTHSIININGVNMHWPFRSDDVLRAAVHSVRVSGRSHAPEEPLESLRSWALVHGLATMINEGTIAPHIVIRL